jgi:hypothetical protein
MMKMLVPSLAALAVLAAGLQPAFAANPNSRETVTFLGNSNNVADPGQGGNGTSSTTTNKGNSGNTNCNDCGSTSPGNSNK